MRIRILAALLALPLSALAAPQYKLTTFGQTGWVPAALNNKGEVVGQFRDAGVDRSYVYSGGTTTILPAAIMQAYDINDHGVIVGAGKADYGYHAYSYANGVATQIGNRNWDTKDNYATAVNNAGKVAGSAYTDYDSWVAFTNTGGNNVNVPGVGSGHSFVNSINERGDLVGGAQVDSEDNRLGFITVGNQTRWLPALGGRNSSAVDINDAGVVAGSAELASGVRHAVLYQNGTLTDLGSPLGGSWAMGINNAGLIVGSANVTTWNSVDGNGFLYANGAMTDLNTLIDPASGWHIRNAVDINEGGQILVHACNATGCLGGLLDVAAPIPEPETYGMLLAGLAMVGMIARRRKGRA